MTTAAGITHQANTTTSGSAQLQGRARALHLMGLLAHWPSVQGDPARLGWTGELLGWEESERARRSLERRLRDRKSTRLNSSHPRLSRMPSSA